MSVVERVKAAIIQRGGKVSVSSMMEMAMSAYPYSYYIHKKAVGIDGDFITAPEVSQMFGEMVSVWVYDTWLQMGSSRKFALIELGPGNGILMRDILRVNMGRVGEYVEIYMLDINKKMIEKQHKNLASFNVKIHWIESLEELPNLPSIFIANEFFDALPINQYVKSKDVWDELVVSVNNPSEVMVFEKTPLHHVMMSYLNDVHINAHDGAIVEESRAGLDYIRNISEHLSLNSGALLAIDYGYDVNPLDRLPTQYYSTLQAVKDHKYHPVLDDVGNADLSAHVDFAALKEIARAHSVDIFGTIDQGEFLNNLGIQIRLNDLQSKNLKLSNVLNKQYCRLTDAKHMGKLFKVMCLAKIPEFKPIGFDTNSQSKL